MAKQRYSLWDRTRLKLARTLLKATDFGNGAGGFGFKPFIPYQFAAPTFQRLVAEGYRVNSAVFACSNALALAFIEPKLRVYADAFEQNGGMLPPKHNLARLLAKPNEDMSMADMLMLTIIDIAIGGNCYWFKVRSQDRVVRELIPLNDSQIEPIAGGDKIISHYRLMDGAQTPIDKHDIIHFRWLWDPETPWKGTSPLIAAAREIDTENEAATYVFQVLKNNAVPPLAIVLPKDSIADDDDIKVIKKKWEEEYGGDNRGKLGVLSGGADVRQISFNLQELAFDALRRIPEQRIAAVMRVPRIVAGLGDDPTLANATEAAKWMTERTLVPLWRMTEEKLISDLVSEFDDLVTASASVGFDLSTVIALSEQISAVREFATSAFTAGLITKNEGRALTHFARVVDGDVFREDIGAIFTPAQIEETTAGGKRQSAGTWNHTTDFLARPLLLEAKSDSPDYARAERTVLDISAGKTATELIERKRSLVRQQAQAVSAQRKVRADLTVKLRKELGTYFEELASNIVERTRKSYIPQGEGKRVPSAAELILDSDDAALNGLLNKYYISIVRESWKIYNTMLGVDLAFNLSDPLVTTILGGVGGKITQITQTTREQLQDALQMGSERGWSIDQLVRGDPDNGIPGLRDLIVETYKNRAECIARTELGDAQNDAATVRYQAHGVKKVRVFDNGNDDDDEPCKKVNGAVKTVEWAMENKLQHPNCTRAFAAEIDI